MFDLRPFLFQIDKLQDLSLSHVGWDIEVGSLVITTNVDWFDGLVIYKGLFISISRKNLTINPGESNSVA